MTNIHFLEMIHQFDDIIQTHVLLQLQEETDMASRLVLISYLEMEMPGNRSQDILKLSVFINQWELGKTCRICLFFYVGFLRSRNLLDRILMGCHEFGIVLIRWLLPSAVLSRFKRSATARRFWSFVRFAADRCGEAIFPDFITMSVILVSMTL